jgi:hypothetical protein
MRQIARLKGPFMTKLHADLEALMPEPVAKVRSWTCGSYHRNYQLDWTGHAKEGETLFTADQVREAMQAATERAAKVVEHYAPCFADIPADAAEMSETFAAAIRAASMHEGGGKTT